MNANTNKTRVLAADDEPPITRQLKKQLEATQRFEVHTENTGRGAIQAALEFKPEVVLLDVMMPDLDGGEVKYQLQQIPELKNTLIIYLTALYQDDHNDKEIFLPKPVNLERILTCISQHLPKRSKRSDEAFGFEEPPCDSAAAPQD